jgi:hypothetical protein
MIILVVVVQALNIPGALKYYFKTTFKCSLSLFSSLSMKMNVAILRSFVHLFFYGEINLIANSDGNVKGRNVRFINYRLENDLDV